MKIRASDMLLILKHVYDMMNTYICGGVLCMYEQTSFKQKCCNF